MQCFFSEIRLNFSFFFAAGRVAQGKRIRKDSWCIRTDTRDTWRNSPADSSDFRRFQNSLSHEFQGFGWCKNSDATDFQY